MGKAAGEPPQSHVNAAVLAADGDGGVGAALNHHALNDRLPAVRIWL